MQAEHKLRNSCFQDTLVVLPVYRAAGTCTMTCINPQTIDIVSSFHTISRCHNKVYSVGACAGHSQFFSSTLVKVAVISTRVHRKILLKLYSLLLCVNEERKTSPVLTTFDVFNSFHAQKSLALLQFSVLFFPKYCGYRKQISSLCIQQLSFLCVLWNHRCRTSLWFRKASVTSHSLRQMSSSGQLG